MIDPQNVIHYMFPADPTISNLFLYSCEVSPCWSLPNDHHVGVRHHHEQSLKLARINHGVALVASLLIDGRSISMNHFCLMVNHNLFVAKLVVASSYGSVTIYVIMFVHLMLLFWCAWHFVVSLISSLPMNPMVLTKDGFPMLEKYSIPMQLTNWYK